MTWVRKSLTKADISGVDMNTVNGDNMPIHTAALYAATSVSEFLLDFGLASPNMLNKKGSPPIHLIPPYALFEAI